jgi:hypothetical protein
VDRIDTDAVLRNGRRRRRIRTGARVGAVVAAVSAVGLLAFIARPDSPPVSVADGSRLSVACSPSGITVSGDVVPATSTGVKISVSSTMPPGAYLNFERGGDPLPATPTTWTLDVPPGPLTLSCAASGAPATPEATHTVTVTDPGGFWRSTTLMDLCPGGMLDWGGTPGSGPSPEAAVNDLVPRLSTDARTLTVARAPIGYRDASSQTWIASSPNGKPYMAVDVERSESGFTASPSILCSG